jgi:hypothetical protein
MQTAAKTLWLARGVDQRSLPSPLASASFRCPAAAQPIYCEIPAVLSLFRSAPDRADFCLSVPLLLFCRRLVSSRLVSSLYLTHAVLRSTLPASLAFLDLRSRSLDSLLAPIAESLIPEIFFHHTD